MSIAHSALEPVLVQRSVAAQMLRVASPNSSTDWAPSSAHTAASRAAAT